MASAPRQTETVAPFSLLVEGTRLFLWTWTHFCSPSSLPVFRTRRADESINRMVLRDLLVLGFLFVAVMAFVAWPYLTLRAARAAVGGLALYRVLDIGLTLMGTGIFGSLRHEATLAEMPRHRIQRTMVAILFNYIELMFWFALLYLWVGTLDRYQFDDPVLNRHDAFSMSMQTLTTVGYGQHAPDGTLALVFTTAQAVFGLVLLVMVIGGLVGSLREDAEEVVERPLAGPNRYLVHGTTPFLAYLAGVAVAYWAVGV